MNILKNSLIERCSQYISEEPEPELIEQALSLQKIVCDNNLIELEDRMGHCLRFGTAGLRAKMEAGYNRLNLVSVYRFSYALNLALGFKIKEPLKVVVGFDARLNSRKFADEVALVLSLLGARVWMFSDFSPTPICAYATKFFKADIGIMITASHNPYYDNGIKLFNSDSSQVHGELLKIIENNMDKAPLRTNFYSANKNKVQIKIIHDEVFNNYLLEIKNTRLFRNGEVDLNISIVYTPLHGVGKFFFTRSLNEAGFNNLCLLTEQSEPDGYFSGIEFPNPEEENTLDLAHEFALNIGVDWVFANDPDADRLQVSCLYAKGLFRKLTGNEMGIILAYFAIINAKKNGECPLVATSIVSSMMLRKMANDLGAKYVDSLTGFGSLIKRAMSAQKDFSAQLVFAYEEALGFLLGQVVLDKDGINTGARFIEIAGFLRKNSKSVWQLLDDLYWQFGVFVNLQWSKRFEGPTAKKTISEIMAKVRMLDLGELAAGLGFIKCQKYDLSEKQNSKYSALNADVVIFESSDSWRLIVRPSGTEPKIKFYLEIYEIEKERSKINSTKKSLNKTIYQHRATIENLLSIKG